MRILIVCNAGMSSSILVNKIKKVAEGKGMDITIDAVSNNGLNDEIGKWDVCLVGPQIMYAVENIKNQLGIPVESIDFRVYAVADAEKALEQAEKLLKGGK